MDFPVFLLVIILSFILFPIGLSFLNKQPAEKMRSNKSSWKWLAASTNLVFKWEGLTNDSVSGKYRGYHLELVTISGHTDTRLTLSVTHPPQPVILPDELTLGEPLTAAQIIHLLLPSGSPGWLKGELEAEPGGQMFIYEQFGVETDRKYLRALFDFMCDLADNYSQVLEVEGEAVPALAEIAQDKQHSLQHIAGQLLRDIEYQTTTRLRDQAPRLFCPRCLTYCGEHQVGPFGDITYYGCRVCGQSRQFEEGRMIAVLDSHLPTLRAQQDGVWRVNWLARRDLFDFDEVEIVQATDEDVERFAVQVGNDTDPARQSRYKEMHCRVSPECRLSENTRRILARMFGVVEDRLA
jgi:RNase P subunit RPR2